jgi:transmembrane sensor
MKNNGAPGRDHDQTWQLLELVRGEPQVRQWLEESDARGPTKRARPVVWTALAAVVVAIGIGALTYWHSEAQYFATRVGEQRDVLLPDGSRVTLNTGTALWVRYTRDSRGIMLERGEALFTVRHDASRPFDVTAGQTVTRAVGTEFNVDLRPTEVTVTVIEGAVHVSAPESGPVAGSGPDQVKRVAKIDDVPLTKGQALEFHMDERQSLSAEGDLKRIEAWRRRRLEFSDTPLPQAVEEINRYSTTRVTIGSPELQSIRVSGVFQIGDTDGFLYSLREALAIQTLTVGNGVVLTRAHQ